MEKPFSAYRGEDPYIFVSYSHEDADIVYPGISWLKDQGFNIWYDEGISPGASWREELARAIMNCNLFVILVSPQSAKSSNCLKELNFALEHNREVLAIHQEPTTLPPGLQLALSDRQAIFRHELTEEKYREKILDGIKSHVQPGQSVGEVVSVPTTSAPKSKAPASNKQALLGVGLLLVLASAVAGWFLTRQPPGPPAAIVGEHIDGHNEPAASAATDEVRSNWLAVLPFASLSAGPEADALATGITTQLIPALAPVPRFNVVPYRTIEPFGDDALGLEEMARQLNVRYLIDGRIQQAGARTRITVELIDGMRGLSLWHATQTFEDEDALSIQDAVTLMTVRAVANRLDVAELERVKALPREALSATELGMLATNFWFDPNQQNLEAAIADLRKALEIDPNDVNAMATLAQLISQDLLTREDISVQAARDEACQLADRAVLLGAIDQGAVNVAYPIADVCGDAERAVQLTERAVSATPENATFWATHGYALINAGRTADGLAALDRAEALDPDGVWVRYLVDPFRALAYMSEDDWEKGVELARRAVNDNPGIFWLQVYLANGLGLLGDYEGARAEWQRVKARFPDVSIEGIGRQSLVPSSGEGPERWVKGLRLANVDARSGSE